MASDQSVEPDQQVAAPAQVAGLLRRLQDERAILIVSFLKSSEIFNSAVLSVEAEHGRFSLDELNLLHGHARVQKGTQLRIEGRLQGVDTRFIAEVDEIELEDGIHLYRCPLPPFIIYRQRRQFHRVPIRLTLQAGISFGGDQPQVIKGRLTDLSAGGVGGIIVEGKVDEGAKLICTIQLPGQPEISTPVEVRFARRSGTGPQRFGAMFLELSTADNRRIQRVVMELERGLRRST
jgi:c-di-GMP-binding flagellar brake protein YcgR